MRCDLVRRDCRNRQWQFGPACQVAVSCLPMWTTPVPRLSAALSHFSNEPPLAKPPLRLHKVHFPSSSSDRKHQFKTGFVYICYIYWGFNIFQEKNLKFVNSIRFIDQVLLVFHERCGLILSAEQCCMFQRKQRFGNSHLMVWLLILSHHIKISRGSVQWNLSGVVTYWAPSYCFGCQLILPPIWCHYRLVLSAGTPLYEVFDGIELLNHSHRSSALFL